MTTNAGNVIKLRTDPNFPSDGATREVFPKSFTSKIVLLKRITATEIRKRLLIGVSTFYINSSISPFKSNVISWISESYSDREG